MNKKNHVIGILGSTLDAIGGNKDHRWERWRPTVSLFCHDDLLIDCIDLIYNKNIDQLLKRTIADIKQVSPQTKMIPHEIKMEDPWDFVEVYSKLYEFFISFPFDTKSKEYLVHISTGTHVAQIILFLLTETNYIPGKLIQTSPSNKKTKNKLKGEYRIIDLDLSKYDKLAQRFKQEANDDKDLLKKGIETKNKDFNHLIDIVENVAAKTYEPILLTGPTGAGKSQLARQIYRLKQKKRLIDGAFVEINCATLRGDSALSTLFGHKKGSFTGALTDRDGLLLKANKGILFLDEIGELGLDEQAMLLNAIEEKSFYPLGSDKKVESDFQLIAGTNRHLGRNDETYKFREDLLARINTWTFDLPGLNKRKEDIKPNLFYETQQFESKNNQLIRFSKEALNAYLDFAQSSDALWCANFRDLNASVLRMCTLAPGGRIDTKTVQHEIKTLKSLWNNFSENSSNQFELCQKILPIDVYKKLDLFELIQLEGVLEVCMNSKTMAEAGRKLYSVSRKDKKGANDSDRIKKYLNGYKITWHDIKI